MQFQPWTRRLATASLTTATVAVLLLATWQLNDAARVPPQWRFPYFHSAVEAAKTPDHPPTAQFGDIYGGAPVHIQKGTGYFTVVRVGDRWTFVTPEGNAFWLRGVYHATEGFLEPTVIPQKYHGDVNLWATQRNRRLLSWGFNTLGEFTAQRGLPIGVWGGQEGNPVRLPFILVINGLMYGESAPGRMGMKGPLKNIVRGVPRTTYDGWPGSLGDLYDPELITAYHGQIGEENRAYTGGFANKSWLLGITPDDADLLYGLKANGTRHAHPVFLIAATKFYYTSAEDAHGREFRDHKLYSKYAWVDFLRNKYGTIEALNTAWGSDYTSFDDDGGYGEGRGLLDEDGRHRAWLGSDAYMLSDTKPAVRADMDAFLYQLARRYADTVVKAIREVDRHHLIFGPGCINSEGGQDREAVLRGFADGGIDVLCVGFSVTQPDLTGDRATYDITGKPLFVWYGVAATRDSGLHAQGPLEGGPEFRSQQERGAAYARDLPDFYAATGKDGNHFILGINFWELIDNSGERINWGLLSRKDNAYDGKEAVRAAGKDPWGYRTGGEDRDYGDFLTAVRNTNFEIQDRLTRDLTPFAEAQKGSKR